MRYLDDLTGKIGDYDQSEAIWIMRMTTKAVVIMIMMVLTCVRFFLHSDVFSVHQQIKSFTLKRFGVFLKRTGFEDLLLCQNKFPESFEHRLKEKTLPMRHLTDGRNL